MKKRYVVALLAVVCVVIALAKSDYFDTLSVSRRVIIKPATVAGTAGALAAPTAAMIYLTGTTKQTSITAGVAGQTIWIKTASTDTLVDGSNLKLAGDFNGTADDILVLTCDGTNWYEVSRSAN